MPGLTAAENLRGRLSRNRSQGRGVYRVGNQPARVRGIDVQLRGDLADGGHRYGSAPRAIAFTWSLRLVPLTGPA